MRASARGFGTKVARAHVMNEHVKRGERDASAHEILAWASPGAS